MTSKPNQPSRDDIAEVVRAEIKNMSRLEELGFEQDEFGQFRAVDCTVLLYSSCGEWEVDIKLPNGSAIGFDAPSLSGRTAAEIAARKAAVQ